MSSNIVSRSFIFSLIYSLVFLSSLEILGDRRNASISVSLILIIIIRGVCLASCTYRRDTSCLVQGDRREPDVFEMISTHLFFNEKAILLQKTFRNCMPFELHIMNER